MSIRRKDESDLDGRYARFCAHPLTEYEVWALAAATMVLPSGNPGAEAYLTYVSGTDGYVDYLKEWAQMVGRSIGASLFLGKGRLRRRAYVEGYQSAWGAVAAQDGLSLAMGLTVPGLAGRAATLGCGRQGFERIRDFVGDTVSNAIAEYRHALRWAHGEMRDRVFEARWEGVTGLKWSDSETYGKMGYPQGACYPLFAKGCAQTPALKDMYAEAWEQPETLYPAIKVSGCWNDRYAAAMKSAPVTVIYKPCLGINRAATDE